MARNKRNVTITLDEETARWLRVEAARRDTSVSQLVGSLVREHMHRDRAYASAMRRFLSEAPRRLKREGARYPAREELHDRAGLR
ncbi:MAG: ribbon-helix-helix protein, CopG family [Gemmatimonadetes bacterium]|nr:ribbon-helix-helix protein, CopG family [Gemmatimonadota bacterium]